MGKTYRSDEDDYETFNQKKIKTKKIKTFIEKRGVDSKHEYLNTNVKPPMDDTKDWN